MRHPQRLLLTLAALITVSSCKSEPPKQPPPKVQAVSTQLAEFTEGVDTVSTLEANNLRCPSVPDVLNQCLSWSKSDAF